MIKGRGGVEYEDIAIGTGEPAKRGSQVELRYDLYLNHGDRVQENQSVSFLLGNRHAIAGLEYGVEGMRVGGVRHLRVGPHLAYRDQAVAGIPANAVLVFHVTLLKIY